MVGSFVTDVVVVAIVLGVMIFIHELGHFAAAKAFGVKVLVFSLGFGKTLLHITRGDTDYRISVLPFGGYVKMAGDDPTDVHEGAKGEFLSQARWKRFVIVVMGPVMNVLLAVGLLTGLYKFHFERPSYLDQVASVGEVDPDSPAAKANVHPGDVIVRFGKKQNPTWADIDDKTLLSANETFPVELTRNGGSVETSVTVIPKGSSQAGYVGWDPVWRGILGDVEAGFPASQAGLKPGDEIVAINGQKVLFFPTVSETIQKGGGKPVTFDVLRDGKPFQVTLQPVYRDTGGEKRWRVGFAFHPDMAVQRLGWGQALQNSVSDNLRSCRMLLDVLGKIATRRMSPKQLTGPIGIAQASGEAFRSGIPDLLMLVAFISLQLGVLNLLPIPVLDGGVIFLLLLEGLMRRELSLAVKERFVQVGIAFLLLLAAFVMYNDIVKTFLPN
jgi:regulator of sigma E protease